MKVKVTVAMDNCVPISAKLPFLGEHGLSMLLEIRGTQVLIDAGQSSAILNNLSLLDVAPSSIDMIAVSHGHYDHTGGLLQALKLSGRVDFCRPLEKNFSLPMPAGG